MLHVIFAAALATSTPAAPKTTPSPLSAALKADQKLGCAVLFVGLDEVIRRNPGLIGKMSDGDGSDKAIAPMLKMLGVSGEASFNTTMTEAIAKGDKPSEIYRRGVASLSSLVADAPVTKTGDDANGERAMAVFTSCLSVMTE